MVPCLRGQLNSTRFGVRGRRFHPRDVLDWIRRGSEAYMFGRCTAYQPTIQTGWATLKSLVNGIELKAGAEGVKENQEQLRPHRLAVARPAASCRARDYAEPFRLPTLM